MEIGGSRVREGSALLQGTKVGRRHSLQYRSIRRKVRGPTCSTVRLVLFCVGTISCSGGVRQKAGIYRPAVEFRCRRGSDEEARGLPQKGR